MRTRFSRFYNLPELMALWREAADIQTADMLNLPVPEVERKNVVVKPTDIQREMVAELGERAEAVRNGNVDPSEDNMLKITNDGRKLALDQRLINPLLPDEAGSKVNASVEEVFRLWQEFASTKGTQLVFCDLSTPKAEKKIKCMTDGVAAVQAAAFSVYAVPFPVSWTVKMKKKQKETQDILSYHSQAAGCSDKARAKASGGRQPIEECGRTGL